MNILEKLTEHEQRIQSLHEEHHIKLAKMNTDHCRKMMLLVMMPTFFQIIYIVMFFKFSLVKAPDWVIFQTLMVFMTLMYLGPRMFFYYWKDYRANKEALFLLCLGGKAHE